MTTQADTTDTAAVRAAYRKIELQDVADIEAIAHVLHERRASREGSRLPMDWDRLERDEQDRYREAAAVAYRLLSDTWRELAAARAGTTAGNAIRSEMSRILHARRVGQAQVSNVVDWHGIYADLTESSHQIAASATTSWRDTLTAGIAISGRPVPLFDHERAALVSEHGPLADEDGERVTCAGCGSEIDIDEAAGETAGGRPVCDVCVDESGPGGRHDDGATGQA